MSEDKPPLTDGVDPLQRLTSLKPPRDLTLGGTKPTKKVFAPNLNVTRNKNKGTSSTNVKLGSDKKDSRHKDSKNDRNRNRNAHGVIKSSGVFSEGLGAVERHSNRITYGRDTAATSSLQKPTIRVKDIGKIDQELGEEQKNRTIIVDDDDEKSDDGVNYTPKNILDRDAPIKLPMDDGYLRKSKPPPKVKQEVFVKQEPSYKLDADMLTDVKPPVNVKEEVFDESDIRKIFTSESPTLIFLQLPDTLPGRGASADDDATKRRHKANEPSTSGDAGSVEGTRDAPTTIDNRCHLSDLEEGLIGKLLIHRSGKVSLKLGDTLFEVRSGIKTSFYQEVVSVSTDDASRTANMIAMGSIQNKITIIPDWDALFRDMSL